MNRRLYSRLRTANSISVMNPTPVSGATSALADYPRARLVQDRP